MIVNMKVSLRPFKIYGLHVNRLHPQEELKSGNAPFNCKLELEILYFLIGKNSSFVVGNS